MGKLWAIKGQITFHFATSEAIIPLTLSDKWRYNGDIRRHRQHPSDGSRTIKENAPICCQDEIAIS